MDTGRRLVRARDMAVVMAVSAVAVPGAATLPSGPAGFDAALPFLAGAAAVLAVLGALAGFASGPRGVGPAAGSALCLCLAAATVLTAAASVAG